MRTKAAVFAAEVPGTAAQFADYLRAEVAKWAPVVKTTGIAQVQ